MKQVTLVSGTYLLIEVPYHSVSFDLDFGGQNLICHGEYVDAAYIETPPGQWSIIGRPNEILLNDEWLNVLAENNCNALTTLILRKNGND